MSDDTFWLGFWIATILYLAGSVLTLLAFHIHQEQDHDNR